MVVVLCGIFCWFQQSQRVQVGAALTYITGMRDVVCIPINDVEYTHYLDDDRIQLDLSDTHAVAIQLYCMVRYRRFSSEKKLETMDHAAPELDLSESCHIRISAQKCCSKYEENQMMIHSGANQYGVNNKFQIF